MYTTQSRHTCTCITCTSVRRSRESCLIQPIADRVARNLEICSEKFQCSTRCPKILMGLLIYYLVITVNPIGRILIC